MRNVLFALEELIPSKKMPQIVESVHQTLRHIRQGHQEETSVENCVLPVSIHPQVSHHALLVQSIHDGLTQRIVKVVRVTQLIAK